MGNEIYIHKGLIANYYVIYYNRISYLTIVLDENDNAYYKNSCAPFKCTELMRILYA